MYLITSSVLVTAKKADGKPDVSLILLGTFNIIIAICTIITGGAIYLGWLTPN
jgi:hypothetical protein